MTVRYDIKQVSRYVLIKKSQKAARLGFSTITVATCDYDMSEFPRYADATMAAYALIRDLGAQHDSLGLPEDDRPDFDVKKVTRYVLTRTMNTDKGATVADLAEFTRRDDAERVAGTMRAAIHPVEPYAPVAYEGRGIADKQAANDAAIRIGDFAISLAGIDVLDPLQAIDLLESRVANARHLASLFSKRANS